MAVGVSLENHADIRKWDNELGLNHVAIPRLGTVSALLLWRQGNLIRIARNG
jgi:hypothetical protein